MMLFQRKRPAVAPHFQPVTLSAETKGEVLASYTICGAQVDISQDQGRGRYTIREPLLSVEETRLLSLILERLYYSLGPLDSSDVGELRKYVDAHLEDTCDELGVLEVVRPRIDAFDYYVHREIGYSMIQTPMMDPDVEEVECTGPGRPVTVVHRVFSEFPRLETNAMFGSEEELSRFVERMAERGGKSVSVAVPKQDFMVSEGHRVSVTYSNEITRPGSTFTVRKFPDKPYTITELFNFNTISPLEAAYLWILAEARRFIMIAGPTGSGKTTMLNSLLTMLDPLAKIATIEDDPELRLPHGNWLRYFTRSPSFAGVKAIGMDELVRHSLRNRPDYIVVGEVRGTEIADLVQAVATGHGGLNSFHAASYQDIMARITGLLAPDLASEFRHLISAVVVMRRVVRPDTGKMVRRVVEILEPDTRGEGSPVRIFCWNHATDTHDVDRNLREEVKMNKPADGQRPKKTRAAAHLKTLHPQEGTNREVLTRYSQALRVSAEMVGWSVAQLDEELSARWDFLNSLLTEGVREYADVASRLSRFYYERKVGRRKR
jgi:flagellar protein FlaI